MAALLVSERYKVQSVSAMTQQTVTLALSCDSQKITVLVRCGSCSIEDLTIGFSVK